MYVLLLAVALVLSGIATAQGANYFDGLFQTEVCSGNNVDADRLRDIFNGSQKAHAMKVLAKPYPKIIRQADGSCIAVFSLVEANTDPPIPRGDLRLAVEFYYRDTTLMIRLPGYTQA